VDPRAGLDNVKKKEFLTLPGLELRTIGRPARSKSLYRLRYSGYTQGVSGGGKIPFALALAGVRE
jgi:hypothetical protein